MCRRANTFKMLCRQKPTLPKSKLRLLSQKRRCVTCKLCTNSMPNSEIRACIATAPKIPKPTLREPSETAGELTRVDTRSPKNFFFGDQHPTTPRLCQLWTGVLLDDPDRGLTLKFCSIGVILCEFESDRGSAMKFRRQNRKSVLYIETKSLKKNRACGAELSSQGPHVL